MKEDKILLVTGASSDLGSAMISRIAPNYSRILAHYRRGEAYIQSLQRDIGEKILPLQADLADPEDVSRLIGRIREENLWPDHVVHLASPKTVNKKFAKHTWAEYEEMVNTSVRPFVEILREVLPHMQKQHYGKAVVMLTSCTCGVPPKYQTPYVSAKYMLLGLMKALAAEYADKGITVNGISPDMVETKFLADTPELIVESNAQGNPLKRNLKIEDVIPALEFLLSDGADTLTGQNLVISGGKIF